MAVDESLFLNIGDEGVVQAFRLYQSNGKSVSLGYFQKNDYLNLDFLREKQIAYVRRITGGRAVMQGDDLFIAFTANKKSPFFSGSISKITNKFADLMVKLLNEFGVKASVSRRGKLSNDESVNNFHCFNSLNRNEILVDNKKIIGIALKKNDDSFLLQASLLMRIDRELFLNSVNGCNSNTIDSITSLEEQLHREININEIFTSLKSIFLSEGFAIRDSGLLENEQTDATYLLENKYRNPAWNNNFKAFLKENHGERKKKFSAAQK